MKARFCTSCGSERSKGLKGYEEHHLVRCLDCGLVYSSQVPGVRDLEEHYNQYGRNDFLSPVTQTRYGEILGQLEKLSKGRDLLDVGCGIGFFLDAARDRSWNCQGTEISDKAVDICREKGHRTHKGRLSEIDLEDRKFDVITAFEVVEHVEDVGAFAREVSALLKPGGLLYLTTPNFNSLNRRFIGSRWNVISYPEHLHYFTPGSLRRWLWKYGYSKVFQWSEGFSPTRLTDSIKGRAPDHSKMEGGDEWLRKSLDSNYLTKVVKRWTNFILNSTGTGESLKALYRFRNGDNSHP